MGSNYRKLEVHLGGNLPMCNLSLWISCVANEDGPRNGQKHGRAKVAAIDHRFASP
jgi:hypothetical protein